MPQITDDQAFGQTTLTDDQAFGGASQPPKGPLGDTIYGTLDPVKRILSAFGQGPSGSWGTFQYDLAKKNQQLLKDAKLHEDYQSNHLTLSKAVNEAFIRPAMWAGKQTLPILDTISGGIESLQRGFTQIGKEISSGVGSRAEEYEKTHGGVDVISRGIAGFADIGSTVAQGQYFGELPFHTPEVTPEELLAARMKGQIAEGEHGFFNTVPVSEENLKARVAAADELGIELPTINPPVTDIHAIARQVDPYTFKLHDKLTNLQDNLRTSRAYVSGRRGMDTERDILKTLADVGGDESQLSALAAGRLRNLRERLEFERAEFTPEMQRLQQQLIDTDLRLRELGPDISSAYDHANSLLPELDKEYQEDWMKYAENVSRKENLPAEKQGPPQGAPLEKPEFRTNPGKLAQEHDDEVRRLETEAHVKAGLAQHPLQGTSEIKTRGLSSSIEAKAIEHSLADNFGDLPEYRTMSMADQASRAQALISKDYNIAKSIALGNKSAPEGLSPISVFIAVEKRAIAEGDVETLRALATNSHLSGKVGEAAQTLRILAERDPTSPTGAIKAVQDARRAAQERRVGKNELQSQIDKEAKAIKDKIGNKLQDLKPEDWEGMLNNILCNY